jgi:hypothetical protein
VVANTGSRRIRLSDDVAAEGSEVLMPKLYHAAPVKATAKAKTGNPGEPCTARPPAAP